MKTVKVRCNHAWSGAPWAGISRILPSQEPQELPEVLAHHLVDTHPYWFEIIEDPSEETTKTAPEPVVEMVEAPVNRQMKRGRPRKR